MSFEVDNNEIDPDLFDALIQVLAATSAVATLANTLFEIRREKKQRNSHIQKLFYLEQIDKIEKASDGINRHLNNIVSLFRAAAHRKEESLTKTKPGFGRMKVYLDQSEFNYYLMQTGNLTNSYQEMKGSCLVLTQAAEQSILPGEDKLSDYLENMNERINDILFSSTSFEEMIEGTQNLYSSSRSFIDQLRRVVSTAN